MYVAEANCGSLTWANHSTCNFSVVYLCTIVPPGAFACQRARASPLGIQPPFYAQQHVRNRAICKRMKNMAYISVSVGICAALFSGVMNCLPHTPL